MLESFDEYYAHKEVPQEFKRISLLHAVSAVIGRQVWWRTQFGITYPNIFSLLVGGPGTGKSQAVEAAEDLILDLAQTQRIHLAAHNFTKASMLDQLAHAERDLVPDPSRNILDKILFDPEKATEAQKQSHAIEMSDRVYHHLSIFNSEFGTMTGQYAPDMLSCLSTLFDSRPLFVEQKRSSNKGEPIIIYNPSVSMITGSQPRFLTEHMPITAWQQGFATRLWIEYIPQSVERRGDLFGLGQGSTEIKLAMMRELERLSLVSGEIVFNPEAKDWLRTFYLTRDRETAPRHSILDGGHNDRRTLKVQKYAILVSLCRREELVVHVEDLELVFGWMMEADVRLVDMFEDMGTSSDAEVLQAVWEFINRKFIERKVGTATTEVRLFIARRGDVHKAPKYITELTEMGAIRTENATVRGIVDKTREIYYPVKGFEWK